MNRSDSAARVLRVGDRKDPGVRHGGPLKGVRPEATLPPAFAAAGQPAVTRKDRDLLLQLCERYLSFAGAAGKNRPDGGSKADGV